MDASPPARQYWLIAYEADRALKAEDFVEGLDVGACESVLYVCSDEGRAPKELWVSLVFLNKRKRCSQLAVATDAIGRLWVEHWNQKEGGGDISIKSSDVDCAPIRDHILKTSGELHLMQSTTKRKGRDEDNEEEIELRRRERLADLKLRVFAKEKQLQDEATMREQRAKEEARKKLDEECMLVKGRKPYKRSDTSRFIEGAPLWFHMEFQKFSLRYDIDDLIDWEPIDEQHRPRFRSNYPEDFLNRRPDWQNYDIDDEKISSMRSNWTMKLTDRRERWYAEVAALSKEEQDAFAEVRKTMLAEAVSALKDEGRIARCTEALGRPPLKRSDQRFFTSGAGLSFHIYVQGFDLTHDIDDVYQGPALLTKRPRVRITDVEDALVCFEKEWDADYDISEVEAGLIIRTLKERVAKMSCPYKAKLSFNYPYV